jgi:sialate O-acetylesterase
MVNSNIIRRGASALAALCLSIGAAGEAMADDLKFAAVFSDHAVLQRDTPLVFWGTATPNAQLTLGFAGKTVTTRADAGGSWRITVPAQTAGGPYAMTVSDATGHAATLSDIMVGDVWLCSGQSNMELTTGAAQNAWNEVHASANPLLRFINIERDAAPTARADLHGQAKWQVAGPLTTGASSAACYYMSKALQASQKVAIGFVNASWGGTPIEGWIAEPALRKLKRFDDKLDTLDRFARAAPADQAALAAAVDPPWQAGASLSVLYNGMIAPLADYRFKGVAWYQGESNWREPDQYALLLSTLIADWRGTFKDPALPFLVVQLPNYGAPGAQGAWPRIRDAERQVSVDTPGVGLAVTLDIGDRFDIHPGEKAVVGARLALAARELVYHEAVQGSPIPVKVERQGADLSITFADTAGGLKTYSADQAIGFEVCDEALACHMTTARADHDRIVLVGANRPDVRSVRYAWFDAPFTNLFGGSDLPIPTFQMDVK